MLGCMHALLLTKANTQLVDVHGGTAPQWAEVQGQPTTAELIRLHAAPPQHTFAAPYAPPDAERSPASHAAPPDAGEPAVSSAASLPVEMFQSAQRGELQKVVKWLGKGGLTDALCSTPSVDGRTSTFSLLHAAAGPGQLELVKELLKRGASVDLPTSLGLTALMVAAFSGHLSTLLLLLQYSANLDLQSNSGVTALMKAAHQGQEACVQALLRARANIELLDGNGRTALQHAERRVQSLFENSRHTATAALIRKQVCLSDYPAVVCSLWAGLHAHMMKISIAAGVLTPLIRVIAFTILSNLPEIRRVRGLVGRLVGRLVRRLVRWRLAYWLSLGLCLGLASESGF